MFYISFFICFLFFFFNDTATTEIYTLSLHDALPISVWRSCCLPSWCGCSRLPHASARDRKSTRLNSSHEWISYAVFCLKKKNNEIGRSNQLGNGSIRIDTSPTQNID